eukprot:jgi/Ulvmu1/3462/UM016_0082.1
MGLAGGELRMAAEGASAPLQKQIRNDRPAVVVVWILLSALSVALLVTYIITIRNLVMYDYIEVSSGPRLASNVAYLVALAIPPVMAIIFFMYWSIRCWTTMRMQRDRAFLAALKVSFLGICTLYLQAGLIMQSYHGSLQAWEDGATAPGRVTPPPTDNVQHVEAALEATFGLAYTLAGLFLVVFLILLDTNTAGAIFGTRFGDGASAAIAADPRTRSEKALAAAAAAAAYASLGERHLEMQEVMPVDAGAAQWTHPRWGPDTASSGTALPLAHGMRSRSTAASMLMHASGSSSGEAAAYPSASGSRHSSHAFPSVAEGGMPPSDRAVSEVGSLHAPAPGAAPGAGLGAVMGSGVYRSSQLPQRAGAAATKTVGGTTQTSWSDFQRAAEGCAMPADELEVALDALCAMETPFLFRYNILSAVDRRVGGQGLVQFATMTNSQQRAAIKFYLDRAAFERERELYTQSALRAMMPATLAIDDNATGDAATPYGYKFPPFVIIECGQSLDEWARRNRADFITIFQSLSHAVRALTRLHSCGYAHRDVKPGNILRRPNQHDWTLIDFGCTAQIGTIASLSYSLRYTPPEVVRELEAGHKTIKVDPAVDIWAIGVIAFELLTGARALPSSGMDPDAAEQAALDAISGRTPLPWEQEDAAPALEKLRGLKRTVLRCLERDPARRPSSEALLASWDHTFDNMQAQGTVFTRSSDGTPS